MASPQETQTGIELKLSFFPLAIFLLACTPRVKMDNTVVSKYWGTHFLSMSPGRHTLGVYFRYFGFECGKNGIEVDVPDGKTVKVSYYMTPLIFLPGSLERQRDSDTTP